MSLDRTTEFKSFASTLPCDAPSTNRVLFAPEPSREAPSASGSSAVVGRYGLLSASDLNPSVELREFHTMASGISSDISITSSQLAELAKLVRSRHLFLAEEDTTKINSLVGNVKANIESLHFRLDEAQRVLNEKKKRIPKNSQAGQEATNVVDQLRHEFVQATQGFKRVLQQRSDGMKEVQDRKSAVLGQSDNSSNTNKSMASAVMGNRPPVYGRSHTLDSTLPSVAGRTLIGGSSAMPLLDLSSAYLPPTSMDTPGVGDSAAGLHLPRPRK